MARAGISGVGAVSALGHNIEETRRALYAASPVLPRQPSRFETRLHLPVFELDLPELQENSSLGLPLRFLRIALEEALKNARLTPEMLKKRRVGVAVGTTVACQLDNIPCHARLRRGDHSDLSPAIPYITGLPAEYLRRELHLCGPALTISNACASGADAAMIGLDWLRTGYCDLVIAAGCDSVSKVAYNGFNALRVCSDVPCRPFDANRTGLNLGDAAGVIILEPPEAAAQRGIRQEYELGGAGKTADAFHITQPECSGKQLERAIELALTEADLKVEEIDFVNAHGTGTRVNDQVESQTFARIFGPGVRFQSTKAMTGHTLGAAGAIELIFSELMLQQKQAAANPRYEHSSEEIPVAPLTVSTPIPGDAALSTSLAFGGSNTALAIRKIRQSGPDSPLPKLYIAAFSILMKGEPDREALMRICRKYGFRRPDRLTQIALTAADAAAEGVSGNDTALITATAYGPANTTGRVLDDILDYPEEEILPTGFSHSVINAASSYIGTALKIHGPTFALAGFEDPFYEAVDLARLLLACGQCRRVLAVACDEKSLNSEAMEPLRRTSIPTHTEGGCALLLTSDPAENRFGQLLLSEEWTRNRLLPCGIPADLPGQLAAGTPDQTVVLRRLTPSEWHL